MILAAMSLFARYGIRLSRFIIEKMLNWYNVNAELLEPSNIVYAYRPCACGHDKYDGCQMISVTVDQAHNPSRFLRDPAGTVFGPSELYNRYRFAVLNGDAFHQALVANHLFCAEALLSKLATTGLDALAEGDTIMVLDYCGHAKLAVRGLFRLDFMDIAVYSTPTWFTTSVNGRSHDLAVDYLNAPMTFVVPITNGGGESADVPAILHNHGLLCDQH